MTELVALHSVLRPGREEGYDAAHERIPEDLIEAHRRAGIQDWRIWRSGNDLFHLVECDDFGAAMRSLESEPANRRWQAVIGDYVDHFRVTPSGTLPLPLVWRMRDQIETISSNDG
jgi:L-rhamnose mutarotase